MPTVKPSLNANRIQAAARGIAKQAGEASDFWKGEASYIRSGASREATNLVNNGTISPEQLPDVARELLRRGSDWNPFNNFGTAKALSSDVFSHRISGSDLKEAAAAVAALADKIGVSIDD
jgi:hypothetical protein